MARIYDYIVVGSGSGGAAVAARLAEDASTDVLLLEAGGSDRRLEVRAPAAFPNQFHTKIDWDYFTEPEPGAGGRRIYEPRGKVLGGCSSMNAMLWMRGSASDYDSWNLPGWSWAEVQPTFLRIEDHFLNDGEHGQGGPMRVTRQVNHDPISELFVEAAGKSAAPLSDDVSGPNMHGATISPVSIVRGSRWNTARGYLNNARKRKNLTVVAKALAYRVVIKDGRATGVEYERRGKLVTAHARREVVLSAGAFGTPHLLQLSGIGDAAHLASIGVDCIVDNAHVGAHLAEHPLTLVNWELTAGHVGLFDAKKPKYLLEWLTQHGGKLSSNVAEAVAHVKTLPDLRDPDFQLLFGPTFFWENGAVEVTPGAAVQTDAELEEWVRNHAEHTYHPSCTARMGAEGEGVLDERLRVRGVSGLRVADTSALPRITHANTNAPAILVGEKCAEFIRAGN